MTYRCGLKPTQTCSAGLVPLSAAVFDPEISTCPKLPEGQDPAHLRGPRHPRHANRRGNRPRNPRPSWKQKGYQLEYREYNMGHEIPFEVLRDLIPWLTGVLPPLRD